MWWIPITIIIIIIIIIILLIKVISLTNTHIVGSKVEVHSTFDTALLQAFECHWKGRRKCVI